MPGHAEARKKLEVNQKGSMVTTEVKFTYLVFVIGGRMERWKITIEKLLCGWGLLPLLNH